MVDYICLSLLHIIYIYCVLTLGIVSLEYWGGGGESEVYVVFVYDF